MKTCTKCGREMPATLDFFYRHKTCLAGLTSMCRECTRAAVKAYAHRNPDKVSERGRAYYAEHRDEIAARARRHYRNNDDPERIAKRADSRAKNVAVAAYREWREESGCLVCGVRDHRIIQGHHVDPTEKERSLAHIRDAEAMKTELRKCVPLCANDHILVHEALRNGHRGCDIDEIITYLKE